MAEVKIELNRAGVRALLQSPEMLANLRERAHRIANAAGEGFEVEMTTSATRAHATIRTATWAARRAEARDRALTKALDAGR